MNWNVAAVFVLLFFCFQLIVLKGIQIDVRLSGTTREEVIELLRPRDQALTMMSQALKEIQSRLPKAEEKKK